MSSENLKKVSNFEISVFINRKAGSSFRLGTWSRGDVGVTRMISQSHAPSRKSRPVGDSLNRVWRIQTLHWKGFWKGFKKKCIRSVSRPLAVRLKGLVTEELGCSQTFKGASVIGSGGLGWTFLCLWVALRVKLWVNPSLSPGYLSTQAGALPPLLPKSPRYMQMKLCPCPSSDTPNDGAKQFSMGTGHCFPLRV